MTIYRKRNTLSPLCSKVKGKKSSVDFLCTKSKLNRIWIKLTLHCTYHLPVCDQFLTLNYFHFHPWSRNTQLTYLNNSTGLFKWVTYITMFLSCFLMKHSSRKKRESLYPCPGQHCTNEHKVEKSTASCCSCSRQELSSNLTHT